MHCRKSLRRPSHSLSCSLCHFCCRHSVAEAFVKSCTGAAPRGSGWTRESCRSSSVITSPGGIVLMEGSGRRPVFRVEDFWLSPRCNVSVFTEGVAIDEVNFRSIVSPSERRDHHGQSFWQSRFVPRLRCVWMHSTSAIKPEAQRRIYWTIVSAIPWYIGSLLRPFAASAEIVIRAGDQICADIPG